jgi:hypothetical protein
MNNLLPASYLRHEPVVRDETPSGNIPRQRRRRWHRGRLVLGAPLLLAVYLMWSLIGGWMTRGNQSFSAKWADWLRSHHAAVVVNKAEAWYYNHDAPAKGGRPKGLNPLPFVAAGRAGDGGAGPAPTSSAVRPRRMTVPHLAPPRPVPLLDSPALSGEGQWEPVGSAVHGIWGMYEAQFRADTIYTSEITSAVWIDPELMRVRLVPGLTEPGGTWTQPPYITTAQRPTVEAAFNGGFRFADAHGGFYLDGRTAVPLRNGAASLVIYRNGRVDVGSWGSEMTMSPAVGAVLQNLVPMVDHGKVSSAATYNDASIWGSTLGAATVVARSGIGVTADGGVVYVAGPALTARTLAESLQRAGAIRAMTLDINPEWVTFNFFGHPVRAHPTQLTSSRLYPQMQRPSSRYLGPTQESRDFFTVSMRQERHIPPHHPAGAFMRKSRTIERVQSISHLDLSPRHPQPQVGPLALATVLSIGLSLLADALLVVIGTAIFPTTKGYVHFHFSDYSKLTVIGVIVACLAWPVVTRLTSTPRWLFLRLAILVTLVLLLPDFGIWVQGASGEAVLVLVAMHLAIAVVTYNLLVRVAPVGSGTNDRAAQRAESVH